MKRSSSILCLNTFLLSCGYISTNPGPVRHPSGACSKPVRANQHGLQCECCDTWSHRVCVNMTEYQRLGNSWESWFCETCLLPQFADSFFSIDQSINSSFLPSTTNNTLHEDSVLNISRITTEGGGEEIYDPFTELRKVRYKHKNNVLVSYLNINSLRYKLAEILGGGGNPRNTSDLPHPYIRILNLAVELTSECFQTQKCYVTCRATCGRIIIYDMTSPNE